MLIRTSQYKCYRVATVVRIIFFLGIPCIYFLFGSVSPETDHLSRSGELNYRIL